MVMSECAVIGIPTMNSSNKAKLQPLLKKRSNPWSHEVRKTVTTNPQRVVPLFYGDRFIPRRYALEQNESNILSLSISEKHDFLDSRFSAIDFRHKGLKLAIKSSFGVKKTKILECSDIAEKSLFLQNTNVMPSVSIYEQIYGNLDGFDWPCTPRSKFLAFPDTTHDVPYMDLYADNNELIDWCVNGQIAASFAQELFLWTPSLDLTLSYKIRDSTALAYCPHGKYLAIGTYKYEFPVLELWTINEARQLTLFHSYDFYISYLSIDGIAWSHNGKTIACGTASGRVKIFNVPELQRIQILRHHQFAVFMMKFSPNGRFLATSDVQGNVYIYNWPGCEVHVVLRSKRKLRVVIDWHPWNGIDLAISESSPASIVILHVPSREIVAYYQRKDRRLNIDFIAFNKITAELLVSYSYIAADGDRMHEILVMSSLDRIVDVLRLPECSVRFMMWSPSGMQLATAGDDETLTIWHFLPRGYNRLRGCSALKKSRAPNVTTKKLYGEVFTRLNRIR